eukprot:scaffold331_cov349-Prasinococcus_capsulatus_cf.AAC.2
MAAPSLSHLGSVKARWASPSASRPIARGCAAFWRCRSRPGAPSTHSGARSGSAIGAAGQQVQRSATRSVIVGCLDSQFKEEVPASADRKRWVHFVGVGGVGLSALARVAKSDGWKVTGSDIAESSMVQDLVAEGIPVSIGHDESNVQAAGGELPDVVVVTSAVKSSNPEVDFAKREGVPVLKRSEWLAGLTQNKELLAVAGTHGKTTTSAMLAWCLCEIGYDVTAVIGGKVPQFPDGSNAIINAATNRFVLEADEYDGAFLGLRPKVAVITNIELDHVDMFSDEGEVRDSFTSFASQVQEGGCLLLCGDDPGSAALKDALIDPAKYNAMKVATGGTFDAKMQRAALAEATGYRRVETYGTTPSCDWCAMSLNPNPQGGTDFVVVRDGQPLARVSLQMPGYHNVLNSLAVIASSCILVAGSTSVRLKALGTGEEVEEAIAAEENAMKETAQKLANVLCNFSGVSRRFEKVGQRPGLFVFDDYAHHPSEVRATLQAARQRFDYADIWVVFQPHTYSRLTHFLDDFASAFIGAERVIVSEVRLHAGSLCLVCILVKIDLIPEGYGGSPRTRTLSYEANV